MYVWCLHYVQHLNKGSSREKMALFCSKIKIEEELYISHAYKMIILLYFPKQLQCKVLSGMVSIEILNAYITQNFEQQSEDKRKQYTGRISVDKQNPELKKSFITTSSAANSSLVLQKKQKSTIIFPEVSFHAICIPGII